MISDHDIERVAVLMCEELGLEPYSYTLMTDSDTLTPNELEFRQFTSNTSTIHYPINGDPPYEISDQSKGTETRYHQPRWKMFRADAARAIAGWRAVHKFVLTEC